MRSNEQIALVVIAAILILLAIGFSVLVAYK